MELKKTLTEIIEVALILTLGASLAGCLNSGPEREQNYRIGIKQAERWYREHPGEPYPSTNGHLTENDRIRMFGHRGGMKSVEQTY